jgi:tRNA nucleotidyltransferase (CCA-adding enzyme)
MAIASPTVHLPPPLPTIELPQPCFVVGGWVRDQLLGRVSPHPDIDLVLPHGSIETAQAIARQQGGGFVVLDQERSIARVVLPDLTIDCAQQMGDTLLEDLHKRDFTVNAIALNIHTGEIIDPLGGRQDMEQRLMRMIAPANLADDPLRVLRAYRQCAQLNFHIEAQTRYYLGHLSAGLSKIANERVRTELGYLLNGGRTGTFWLLQAIEDGVLAGWLPRHILQIERFQRIDHAIEQLQIPALQSFWQTYLTKERPVIITLKLAALVNSAHGTAPLGFSKNEQKWLWGLLRYLPQLCQFCDRQEHDPVLLYQFFQGVLPFFPALVALAMAEGYSLIQLEPYLHRWLDPHDPVVYPPALITGEEIKVIIALKPSPRIGELLTMVRTAQLQGKITDRGGAIALITTHLKDRSLPFGTNPNNS